MIVLLVGNLGNLKLSVFFDDSVLNNVVAFNLDRELGLPHL